MTYQKSWTDLAGSPLNRVNHFITSGLHTPPPQQDNTKLNDQQWLDHAARELELRNIRTDVINRALDRLTRPATANFQDIHGAPSTWAVNQIVRWKRAKRPALAIPAPHTTVLTAATCRLALALTLCAVGATIFDHSGTMAWPLVGAICLWTTLAPISTQLLDLLARRTLAIRTHMTMHCLAAAALLGIGWWGLTGATSLAVHPSSLWSVTALSWLVYIVLAVANSRRWQTTDRLLSDKLWTVQTILGLQQYVTGGHVSDARRELAAFTAATRQPESVDTPSTDSGTHLETYGPAEDIVSLYLQGAYERLSSPSESTVENQRRIFWGRFVVVVATVVMSGVLLSFSRVAPEQSIVATVGLLGASYRAARLVQERHLAKHA